MSDNVRINNPSLTGILLAAALAVCSHGAAAQDKELSGKDVVEKTCVSCHGPGTNGAPKIGSKEAWSKRASQGLTSLSAHALDGIRKMPAHGGKADLSDIEIKRAVTYMVNQSGGKWVEPIDKKAPPRERSGEQIVKARCMKCHEKGTNGAPKIGDRDAWIPRVKQGLNVVVSSAINGHGAMPPRGGMANLTDAEIRRAVIYMFNKGTGATQ